MKDILIPFVISVLGTHIQLWTITFKEYAKEHKIEKNNFNAILKFTKDELGNIINSYFCTLALFLIIYYTKDKKIFKIVQVGSDNLNMLITYFLLGFFSSYIVDVLYSIYSKEKIKQIIEKKINPGNEIIKKD